MIMKSKGLICCTLVVSLFCASLADDIINVTVTVIGKITLAETDESFVCATLDWWPQDKCDFNCPWGKAGILNLDLDNKILVNAVKAFGNLRIRVGGSLQDQVLYNVGASHEKNCSGFTKTNGGLFGYSRGCLEMKRWDHMNTFFNKTGAVITFGLNALNGRNKSTSGGTLMVGDWNYTNALDFMNYTASKGYKIDSYEFGNELSGDGIAARVGAEQYAKDTKVLKNLIESVYNESATNPKLLGPGGFYHKQWYNTFLNALGPNVVDGVTYHIYNLGSGGDSTRVLENVLSPEAVSKAGDAYFNVKTDIQSFGLSPWVSESGGAFTSGSPIVSNTFADGFWYLNQLGLASKYNHTVFCRQTLVGGNYGLLDVNTFNPKPDYYGALLWHRLMGKKVLIAFHGSSKYLRVYAHCLKIDKGVSLLIINMSNSTTFEVRVDDSTKLYPFEGAKQRQEYHLTPENDNILSEFVMLNGKLLKLTGAYDIPKFDPRFVDAMSPIRVTANSMVFVTIVDYNALVCA